MAEKKAKIFKAEPATVEVADDHLLVRRKIVNGVAICGNCGVRLVNVEERIRCKFCWNCGKPILWR